MTVALVAWLNAAVNPMVVLVDAAHQKKNSSSLSDMEVGGVICPKPNRIDLSACLV
jgi:hypothetical protein